MSPIDRTLSTTQNPIPQIIQHTSPATDQIWVPCSTDVGSFYTLRVEVRVVRRLEEDPETNMRRSEAAEGIGVPLLWRILHATSSECKSSLILTIVQG